MYDMNKKWSSTKAVLSFHQLVENSDESFLLDNEAPNPLEGKSFAS